MCYCSDTLIIYAYCIQPRFPLLYARCTHVFFSFLRSGIATTPLPYPTHGEIALPRLGLGYTLEYSPKRKKAYLKIRHFLRHLQNNRTIERLVSILFLFCPFSAPIFSLIFYILFFILLLFYCSKREKKSIKNHEKRAIKTLFCIKSSQNIEQYYRTIQNNTGKSSLFCSNEILRK